MSRIAIVMCLTLCVGCSRQVDQIAADRVRPADVEDGEQVENADRGKAQEYFSALANVQSVQEEEKLVTEFSEWLKERDYKIRVEVRNGRHILSCPFFPPVTPWTDHTFHDIKNLELLPQ